MGNTTSVKVELNAASFNSEARAMAESIRTVGKETKAADAALQASGSAVERLENKYKGLEKQMQIQSQLSSKYALAVKQSAKAQDEASRKLEAAKKAYADGQNKTVVGDKDRKKQEKDLEKLEKEVSKQERALNRATTAHEKYKGKLLDSQAAEAQFGQQLSATGAELAKQQKYMTGVNEEFTRLQNKTETVRNGLSKTGKALTIGVTAPLVAAGVKAVKVSEQFNKALANIGTLSVPTERLMELKGGIQEIAVAVAKDTTDIADGTYQVISAYGDSADTLEMVEINAKAAAAGLSATTDAINLTSAVTKGYGDVSAEATQKASDLAFETIRLGQTTFPELAASMGKVVPSANALKVSQEELFGVFATLTGVTGTASEVSTQLSAVLKALMKPSGDMSKALKKMGFESGFAAMESLGLQGTLKGLVKITGGSEEALVNLAGEKEAVTAMLALTGAQADTFADKLGQLGNAAGATDRAFQAQSEGVNKAGFMFQQAMIKMQVSAQNFGDSAAPFIEKGADAISGLAEWLKTLTDEDRDRLMKIGVALAAIGPTLSVLSKGITVFNGLSAGIKALGTAGTAASTALGGTSGLSGVLAVIPGPAKVALAAIAGVTAVVGIGVKVYHDGQKAARSYGEAVTDAADEFEAAMKKSYDLDSMMREWETLNAIVSDGTAPAEELTAAKERLKEVEQWLIDNYGTYLSSDTVMNGGGVSEAEIAGLKERNAQLRETAKLQAEIALSVAKERFDAANNGGIEKISKKNDALKAETAELEKQQAILARHNKRWNDTLESDAYKSADAAEKTNLYLEAIGAVNNEMAQFGKDFSGGGFAGVATSLADVDGKIDNNKEKISEYNQQLLEYMQSQTSYQDATRRVISNMLDDMPTETPAAFSDMAERIKALGENAGLSESEMSGFAERMTQIAHDAELIPQDMKIKITADGDIEVINEAGEKVKDLDGEEAEVNIKADDECTDVIAGAEQQMKDLNGKAVSFTVNADGTQAYATINGVQYMVMAYDESTGTALLSADGTTASATVNLKTGEVRAFSNEKGTATLDAEDLASDKAKNAANAIKGIKDKTVKITAVFSAVGNAVKSFFGFAKGTASAPGGPAIINDEETRDPRELVVRDGKGYIFEGRNVPIMTKPGDQIYPAKNTKKIMQDMGVKFFASGTGDTAFERAKNTFSHRKKTSEVTVLEELQWWQELRETMSLAQEEAEEAEEEIYALTKKLNEQSIDDYKDRISDQINDGERWLNQQVKLYNISCEEQIDILNRIDQRHLETLQEMVANTEMTEKEKDEIYQEYYKAREDRIIEIAELEKKKNQEVRDALMEDSKAWTSDRNFYNDWGDYGDDPIAAYNRVRDRMMGEIAASNDPDEIKALWKELDDFGSDMYDQRREDSRRWMETEEYYGNLTAQGKLDALERQRTYTRQYYEAGIIDHRQYIEEMDDLDKQHFSVVKEQLEEAVTQRYDALRQQLDDKKTAIEKEYELEDERKNRQDRDAKLAKLRQQEAIFAGAVTLEGKEKLEDIREQIAELEAQAEDERREKEKEKRLEAVDDEAAELDKREEESLAGISKYAQQVSGVMGQTNADAANQFNALMKQYTAQQEAIAQAGAARIGSIVDWTAQKLKQVKNAEAEAQRAAQRISESGQAAAHNEAHYNFKQINNNYVTDAAHGTAIGLASARAFKSVGRNG